VVPLIDFFRNYLADKLVKFCERHDHVDDKILQRWLKALRKQSEKLREGEGDLKRDIVKVCGASLWIANVLGSLGVQFGLAPNKVFQFEVNNGQLDKAVTYELLQACAVCLSSQYLYPLAG